MIITEHQYYLEQQSKYPDAVILMQCYDSYYILGKNADKFLPIVEPVLTHKHAGKMFCYHPNQYAYSSLSWGKHNLDIVLPAIIKTGARVAICDYTKVANSPERRVAMDKKFEDYRRRKSEKVKEEAKKHSLQLSFFDELFAN